MTDVLVSPEGINYLNSFVLRKANLSPSVTFFRGVPANALVCLAIFLGLTARDVIGKMVGLWVPVFAFCVLGYEHCVANMFFFSWAMMMGANLSAAQFATNLAIVVAGNIVGGGILIGSSEFYLYNWSLHSALERKIKTGIPGKVVPHEDHLSKEFVQLRQRLKSSLARLRKRRPSKTKGNQVENAMIQK